MERQKWKKRRDWTMNNKCTVLSLLHYLYVNTATMLKPCSSIKIQFYSVCSYLYFCYVALPSSFSPFLCFSYFSFLWQPSSTLGPTSVGSHPRHLNPDTLHLFSHLFIVLNLPTLLLSILCCSLKRCVQMARQPQKLSNRQVKPLD